jgi:hypothetical protein
VKYLPVKLIAGSLDHAARIAWIWVKPLLAVKPEINLTYIMHKAKWASMLVSHFLPFLALECAQL